MDTKELRDELFGLRMKLALLKMEINREQVPQRKEELLSQKELIEEKIKGVRRLLSKEYFDRIQEERKDENEKNNGR